MNHRSIVVLFILLLTTLPVVAVDWPQWRGVNGDGVWTEDGIVNKLDNVRVVWRKPVANGYSGPTVADGRVYLMDRLTKPEPVERVRCFNASYGTPQWTYTYPCVYSKVGYPDGPRASVTIDSGRAYALGAMGHLHCLDAVNGDVVWQKDLKSEYRIKLPVWGIAASPVVYENFVIVHIGGEQACIVAFDKITGREVWRALEDKASYVTPMFIEQAEKEVLLCWTGGSIAGLDPRSGKVYWREDFEPVRVVMNIAMPVLADDYLFLSAFFDGAFLYKLAADELAIEKVWQRKGKNERNTDALHCCISTPIIEGESIFGVDSYGELRCLDLKTGDRIWESLDAVPKARWANIHMVRKDDKIWMFNERGELIISKLSREGGFQEISRKKIIEPTEGQLKQRGGVCWSHPAFANKRIYARNDQELVCVDVAE